MREQLGQFVDEATIEVTGGRGGNGCISFRREKFVPRGGPDGGDGGDGGNVYIVANPHLRTLLDYTYRRHFKAGNGAHGSSAHKTGARGKDIEIPVPVGTEVYDAETGELLADLSVPGQRLLIARGGKGGRGNAAFATPTRRAPRIAERGLPGERRRVRLVLKLLADVGIVGMPNAGKSTLISRVSAARPKIAAYPFTTLVPNLGVVKLDDERSFIIADLPGLIEGAHAGAGLGHRFLRHVERTRVLIHLLDAAAFERDIIDDFHRINRELELYDERLARLPQIVAINKVDIPEARARAEEAAPRLAELGHEVFLISAATGEGVRELMERCWQALRQAPQPAPPEQVPMLIEAPPPPPKPMQIYRDEDGTWVVEGTGVERAAMRINTTTEEGLAWLQQTLERLGVFRRLREAGAQPGDAVRIGKLQFEYQPEEWEQ